MVQKREDRPERKIDLIELLTYIAAMSDELATLAGRAKQVIPAHHLKLASDQLYDACEAASANRSPSNSSSAEKMHRRDLITSARCRPESVRS